MKVCFPIAISIEREKVERLEHFLALIENSLWDPDPSIPRAVVKGLPLLLLPNPDDDFFLDDPPKMPLPMRWRPPPTPPLAALLRDEYDLATLDSEVSMSAARAGSREDTNLFTIEAMFSEVV